MNDEWPEQDSEFYRKIVEENFPLERGVAEDDSGRKYTVAEAINCYPPHVLLEMGLEKLMESVSSGDKVALTHLRNHALRATVNLEKNASRELIERSSEWPAYLDMSKSKAELADKIREIKALGFGSALGFDITKRREWQSATGIAQQLLEVVKEDYEGPLLSKNNTKDYAKAARDSLSRLLFRDSNPQNCQHTKGCDDPIKCKGTCSGSWWIDDGYPIGTECKNLSLKHLVFPLLPKEMKTSKGHPAANITPGLVANQIRKILERGYSRIAP